MRIEVIDSGTGIAPAEVNRIFERFYRGSGSLEQEGFGLGLSIARRMVDVMGGPDRGRVDRGRRQYVLGQAARSRNRAEDPCSVIAMRRILIADDEPSVRDAVG